MAIYTSVNGVNKEVKELRTITGQTMSASGALKGGVNSLVTEAYVLVGGVNKKITIGSTTPAPSAEPIVFLDNVTGESDMSENATIRYSASKGYYIYVGGETITTTPHDFTGLSTVVITFWYDLDPSMVAQATRINLHHNGVYEMVYVSMSPNFEGTIKFEIDLSQYSNLQNSYLEFYTDTDYSEMELYDIRVV